MDTSDEEMSSEKEDESRGKGPAPEISGIGTSMLKNPALDSQASEETSLWGEIFFRESLTDVVWKKT